MACFFSIAASAKSAVRVLSLFGARASQMVLFAAVVIIFYDVIMRYVFNSPTTWVLEISEYMLVFIAIAGAADVQRKKTHIKMDFFYNKLTLNVRRCLDIIIHMTTVLFVFLLFMTSFQMTLIAYHYGSKSNSLLGTAMFIPYAIIPFGMGLFLMQTIADLVESIKNLVGHVLTKGQKTR
jgi:TRAP-type C4-dicarboxylate transport system permease small subunit